MEEKKKNIFQRVLAVMAELDYIQKGKKTVNNQYRFASHDQVTAAVHPLLVKHGIVVWPSVESYKQDNNRTELALLVQMVNADEPTDSYTMRFLGYGVDPGDKGPGKAVSYAYKYALLKAFNLETGEDSDNDANARYEPEKCLEFDAKISTELSNDKEAKKLADFLAYSAGVMNKHSEDVKRHALLNWEGFMKGFRNWKPKTKD